MEEEAKRDDGAEGTEGEKVGGGKGGGRKYTKRERGSASVRKSTRTTVIQSREEREKHIQEEQQKKAARRKKEKSTVELKPLTQQEILEEAKITEQQNLASLEVMLRFEEDQQRKNRTIVKPKVVGPRISYYSGHGKTTVTFDQLPPYLNSKAPPCNIQT